MRRFLLLGLGILELAIALTLVRLAWLLPAPGEIERGFAKAGAVTDQARKEIHQVRDQVKLLRRPELQKAASQLQGQLQLVTKTLRDQKVDFDTASAARDGLGGLSEALVVLSKALEADHLDHLGNGLGLTADFLDKKLMTAANETAGNLDKTVALLKKDAQEAAKFLQEFPVDLQALKEVHDSLGQFAKGLDKTKDSLQVKRLKSMKEGFEGMSSALDTGAGQVERLSSFTYPVVMFNGLRPEIERKQFWPEGDKIATGLRKASKGVNAANEELGDMIKNLPEVRESLEASLKIIESTRKTLAQALEQQGKVEPVLKNLPKQAAELAEELPRLVQELSKVLKETKQFKAVAETLRQAQAELKATSKNWPKVQKTLQGSAELLKAAQQQLDQAVHNRKEYEKAVEQTADLGEGFAAMLPLLSQQMLVQLQEQENSLDELGDSLGEVGGLTASYGQVAGSLVSVGTALAWLLAFAAGLHACYMLAGLRKVGKPA